MQTIYKRPDLLIDVSTHYCSGCGHGIIHRIIAEVIDEYKMRDKIIGIAPVGCAVLAYDYIDIDWMEAPHGRTPAVATGIKRVLKDNVVFTYQGDGDLAAIGTAEIIHAANRGEKITVIFVNNANYGMTGGQMAPTTLLGQKTATTPFGREYDNEGDPIQVCELLKGFRGVKYLVRTTVKDVKNIIKTKKFIKKAFDYQMSNTGFSLVEILSACPVNWKMTPHDSNEFISEEMEKIFPLGVIKEEDIKK